MRNAVTTIASAFFIESMFVDKLQSEKIDSIKAPKGTLLNGSAVRRKFKWRGIILSQTDILCLDFSLYYIKRRISRRKLIWYAQWHNLSWHKLLSLSVERMHKPGRSPSPQTANLEGTSVNCIVPLLYSLELYAWTPKFQIAGNLAIGILFGPSLIDRWVGKAILTGGGVSAGLSRLLGNITMKTVINLIYDGINLMNDSPNNLDVTLRHGH